MNRLVPLGSQVQAVTTISTRRRGHLLEVCSEALRI
jgi:hypothetical protein